jgi:hypothetical protein
VAELEGHVEHVLLRRAAKYDAPVTDDAHAAVS